jgi:long-chain acyl-CoA synthetase
VKPLHERVREHAAATPHKAAIIWYGREISYAELDRLSDGCAALLRELGVVAGSRVALFMQNCPQYVVAHLGIQKLGAIVSPCSPLFKSHELAYQLSDLEAAVVIAADTLQPVVESVREEAGVGHLLLVHYQDMLPAEPTYPVPEEIRHPRAIPDPAQDFLVRIRDQGSPPNTSVAMDDLAVLVYTSGTTGRPKGAMLTHCSVVFKSQITVRVMGIQAEDVHLVIPPLYHISGMLCGLDIPLLSGGTVLLHYRFDARSALLSIQRHQVTYWKSITPMLLAAMDLGLSPAPDLSSLRITTGTSFGVRLTPEISHRWARFSGGCEVTESAYGLTETHTFDAIMPRDDVRWETTGKLVPGVRCRIVDPLDGRDVPAGQQGEILLQSEANFLGYWRQPEKTLETLCEGWVHTGDIGTLDTDGYLTFVGRFKEMIKVSGYSVFPEDVEAILAKHPCLERVAVVGVPHPTKGEVVHAFVVPRAGAEPLGEDALVRWCRDNMSAYKVPRRITFVEDLPITASGKVLRSGLAGRVR